MSSELTDLQRLFDAQKDIKRWAAERENATARLELARIHERTFRLLSQHQPVHDLGIDRSLLRLALDYLHHGDLRRLEREHDALRESAP